jgi:Mg-chelatase subunit ChlD
MRPLLILSFAVLFLAALPSPAQIPEGAKYAVEIDKDSVFRVSREDEKTGQKELRMTLQFQVRRLNADGSGGQVTTEVPAENIVVRENGRVVKKREITRPQSEALTAVLALDISGSMEDKSGSMQTEKKIDQAKKAALVFLDRLDTGADTGLILFDHELRKKVGPAREKDQYVAHRNLIRKLVDAAKPMGGTAYLDATSEAVRMLKNADGRKAVVLMTDGVDMASKATLEDVVREAQTLGVPVYTIGVGKPGDKRPVTTVLVLDHSGSMRDRANDTDKMSKIEALHQAASRFVDLMPPRAKTTLLPFSTTVSVPGNFRSDKASLKRSIKELKPEGGTLLYDATYAGIETLAAARPEGSKFVVVLTDGKDEAPGSRHTPDDLIRRAGETGVKLYMLGLGRDHEINEKVMRRIAESTGGRYYHAKDENKLIEIFEKLSIDLHDDGIDEDALKKIAAETGGKYFPAAEASQLSLIFGNLANELQTTYTVTFPSLNPNFDGTKRVIDITIEREGERISNVADADVAVHGVVVTWNDSPQHRAAAGWIYLVLLGALGGLLVVPMGIRKVYKTFGGM